VQGVREDYGRLDILVNSAGTNVRQPADRIGEDDWDRVHDVNVRAMFFACQVAARVMRQSGRGKIINIASTSDSVSFSNVASYAISKAAVRQLTRSLAVEWARDRINVNAIAPGRFWTAMTDAVLSDPERRAEVVGSIPWGREGAKADLGGAAVLLASDAGDYITGQVIHVCGGQSLAPTGT
jgi:NAD(P)-dependent dehydrogenase (short-subunit alcohol dehydrogenase family)